MADEADYVPLTAIEHAALVARLAAAVQHPQNAALLYIIQKIREGYLESLSGRTHARGLAMVCTIVRASTTLATARHIGGSLC